MSRRPFIVGNWKMNKGPQDTGTLASQLKVQLAGNSAVDVGVAPPFISIPGVCRMLQHTGIVVAGQDLHPQTSGAFTSAISGEMIRQAGCSYVIVGHSERRSLFGDDDESVNGKVHAAFHAGLLPILCVGETLAQRESGEAEAIVTRQLQAGLQGLTSDQVASLTLAYEPVWAIGTGLTASPEQAQAMHATIRSWLSSHQPAFVSRDLRIQYGGSVKPGNTAALLRQPDIDGALVGGASLDADSFIAIVQAATG